MTRFIKIAVLAGGASLLAAAPIQAQDLNALNPLNGLGAGLSNNAFGIDLDPFHIFSPAPPVPPSPGPFAEGPVPHVRHRHRLAHHAVARRHIHLKAHRKTAPKTVHGSAAKKS